MKVAFDTSFKFPNILPLVSPPTRGMYYDRHGNVLTREEGLKLFGDGYDRRCARTECLGPFGGRYIVSTVHLVINHQWGDGPPLIFETMVFGGKHDQECVRYSTEEAARVGHTLVVRNIRKGLPPFRGIN
jgi:hypothetical protein